MKHSLAENTLKRLIWISMLAAPSLVFAHENGRSFDFNPTSFRQEAMQIAERISETVCNDGSDQCQVAKDANSTSSDTRAE